MKLPATKTLLATLGDEKVERAVDFLLTKRDLLRRFVDVEDFIFHVDDAPDSYKGIEPNFVAVRQAVAKQLWGRGIYIGITVLDSMIFQSVVHSGRSNPVRNMLENLRDLGLHRPGLVLFPLHSLGVIAGGLYKWAHGGQAMFQVPDFGIVLTPQTNRFETTLQFLDQGAKFLGIEHKPPRDLVEHWRRSRPTEWLEKNPLMLARMSTFPGSYYENQPFLVTRLRLGTGLIVLAGALQLDAIAPPDRRGYLGSSSRLNNFQTLNIRHYFVFWPKAGTTKKMQGDCVPMNARPLALAELSELSVELDPRHWRKRTNQLKLVGKAMDYIGKLINTEVLFKKKLNAHGRVARKLVNSLNFFKRAHRGSSDESEEVINLAIALEVLLTDNYSQGVMNTLKERLEVGLAHLPAALRKRCIDGVVDTYDARSGFVHSGSADTTPDVAAARRAYAEAMLFVTARLPKVSTGAAQPMIEVFGK